MASRNILQVETFVRMYFLSFTWVKKLNQYLYFYQSLLLQKYQNLNVCTFATSGTLNRNSRMLEARTGTLQFVWGFFFFFFYYRFWFVSRYVAHKGLLWLLPVLLTV